MGYLCCIFIFSEMDDVGYDCFNRLYISCIILLSTRLRKPRVAISPDVAFLGISCCVQ